MLTERMEEEPVKEFSCPICLEVLYKPLSLPECQHSMCLPCAKRLFAGKQRPSCPVCRADLAYSVQLGNYNHSLDDSVKKLCPKAWQERANRPQEKPRDIQSEVISGVQREIARDDQQRFMFVPATVYSQPRRRVPPAYEPYEPRMYYPPPRIMVQPRNPVRDITIGACVILLMFTVILCMLYYFVSLMGRMIH